MSKYLYNIKLRPESREPIVGGMPFATLLTMSTADTVLGGGGNHDSLRKIAHLSVPVGLVLTKSYMANPIVKSTIDDKDDIIQEHIFDKLYRNTTYQTSTSTSNTKKRHSRKIARK